MNLPALSFFQDCLAILGLLHFLKNCRISWLISVKRFSWDFGRDGIEFVDQLGEYCHRSYKSSNL